MPCGLIVEEVYVESFRVAQTNLDESHYDEDENVTMNLMKLRFNKYL